MEDELIKLNIKYGRDGCFCGNVLAKRTLAHFQPQPDIADIASAARSALEHPLEFPAISQACVPGDRIVIAIDPQTPRLDAIVALLWKQFDSAEINAQDVSILQSPVEFSSRQSDPRSLLPPDAREVMGWHNHDPSTDESTTYLATTAGGQRIYLAREIVDADLVIPIGTAMYHPLLGVSGESTVLYPALSNLEAIQQAAGEGHDELTPEDVRPLRQLAEEVAWLLGMQFSISVVPGNGTGVQSIHAGSSDAVSRATRKELNETCRVEISERAETVVVAADAGPLGESWDGLTAVIDTARRLVERDGRIVVLSQLDQQLGPGLQRIRDQRTPQDASQQFRQIDGDDYLAAGRLVKAVDWANVYLVSQLPANIVEDLFMIPLESDQEIQKILDGDDTMVILESAQKVFASCR